MSNPFTCCTDSALFLSEKLLQVLSNKAVGCLWFNRVAINDMCSSDNFISFLYTQSNAISQLPLQLGRPMWLASSQWEASRSGIYYTLSWAVRKLTHCLMQRIQKRIPYYRERQSPGQKDPGFLKDNVDQSPFTCSLSCEQIINICSTKPLRFWSCLYSS